jgi:hypothetical protein
MTSVTAPGVERALGPIVGRVKRARANYDPQLVKLMQMAITIIGYRLSQGDYPRALLAARPERYQAFAPYDLATYGRGLQDFTIPDRDVFAETIDEKVDRLMKIATLIDAGDPWLLEQAGVPADEVKRMLTDQQEKRDAALQAFAPAQTSDTAIADNGPQQTGAPGGDQTQQTPQSPPQAPQGGQ